MMDRTVLAGALPGSAGQAEAVRMQYNGAMLPKNPFPGMNPYLEQRWGDVHAALITYLRDQIQEQLPADLRARMQERVFVESYLDTESKSAGKDRDFYPDVHVVERPLHSAHTS